MEYVGNDRQKKYIANLDDGITFKTDSIKGHIGSDSIPMKLNQTYTFSGDFGEGKTTDDLSNGNIAVVAQHSIKMPVGGGTATVTDDGFTVKLAKDLKGITSIGNQTTKKDGNKEVTTGARIVLNDNGTTTISGGNVNVSNHKVTGLADGTEKTDAVTVQQLTAVKNDTTDGLANKANVDASNIGANLKGSNGTSAAPAEQITLNENAWGKALGTGSVTTQNGQLVTGGTVFNALQNQKNDLTDKLSVNAGWGINIDKTKGNTISLERNLGTNNGNTNKGTGKVTFEANGTNSLILGGQADTFNNNNVKAGTDGQYSVLVGGRNNYIDSKGTSAVIAGGFRNSASGIESAVFGGGENAASGPNSAVLGGSFNKASGEYSTVIGGGDRFDNYGGNHAEGTLSTIIGGYHNDTWSGSENSVIVGGRSNSTYYTDSVIVGGGYNVTYTSNANVFGGYGNWAGNNTTISGGVENITLAYQAYALSGYANQVSGYLATSLGGQNQKVIGNYSTAIGGASTGRTAENATAIGSQAVVTAKNGLALGYKATADKEGTISFGHDKGDISGYDSKIKLEDGSYSLSDIQKYLVGATSGEDNRDVIYTPTYYESAEYNRLVKVSDGKDAHDAVVMEQLTPYTKSDASNIGSNLKTYTVGDDGETITETDATEEQQKANKDAWGKALGADTFSTGTDATPTNASTSDQLVTGKTLYDYDKPTDSQNYVKVNNTTGQNLSALDAQVKANADELNKPNHNIKYYSVNETAPLMNSDAYKNDGNDGAKGEGSLAAGFVTHADGIASTVAGSYSGVINSGKAQGLDLRGAAALSYGTFNVNQNTDAAKDYSGVANSIVGQANMTKDSNAAIIYGAGNIVTDSYRPIDEKKAAAILGSVNDPAKLGEAMKDAVETSGGQVMVMGGGNSVDKAYMTQVTGVGNKVSGQDSTYAEGTSTQYNFVDGFQNELTNGKHDYIIGTKNKVSGDSVDKNQSNIIFGDNHTLTNTKNAVIIGSSDKVTEMAGSDAVSIGYNANAGGESVALGSNAVAGGNALAVGPYANAKNNSIALGIHASATSSQNLAIGYYANVTGRPDTIKNSVALGASSTVGEKDILSTDNGNGILSIGAKDKERRIIHVRAGVNDTDAVNVSQLKSAQNDLTGKGLKFAANSGDVYTAKLGSTVKIQGTDKKADHEYTADNLTTEIDKNGNITILMDKDMSVEKLAVNGKDGKDGKPGTAGSIGISGQDGKAGVGIDGKDGISIKGKDGKDGVTMKAVDGKNGTEGHIGLTGPAGTNGKDGTNAIDITVKNGYDGANGINGKNGVDGTSLTRIVYTDKTGEHQVATMEDGLKFKGDDTTVINKKLNNTLEIIGGAKGDLTENNIGVNSTKEGKLKVQLSKNLTGMNSTTYTTTTGEGESATISTTVVNGNGLTITNGPSITNKGVDGGNKVITNVGSGIEQDANGKYTVTDQNKGNAANVGDVQNMVNDAKTELTDGANGLNKKANIDASNIGANLKGADGKTPASDAEKTANKDAWGKAIGTDKIEANNGQLVTSKAVYDEVRPKEDGNYVKKDKTTGENLSALDSKIGKLDKDGNYIKKDDSISKNLSTLDTQVKNNADAIQNITNNVKNLSDNAVQYDKDSNKSKVTLAGKDGTTITNVKDGSVAKDSKDAVNGGQLYEVNEKVTNNTNEITKIENGEGFTDAGKTVIKNLSKDAVQVKAGDRIKVDEATDEKTGNKTYTISANNNGTVAKGDDNLISGNTLYKEVHVDNDGSYIKGSNTVGQNLSALDTGLKTTSDLIHTNDKGDTIQIGGNSTATKIDVNGKDGKGRVITGVVTDAGDPNSAANVGYVNGLTAANTQQIYRDMSNAYSRLDTNINRAAAGSNALAALHPLDFDPADKASFAVGYGHYHNANAAAVGAFYQPNANTMVNMGISLGNGDPGFNAGVSFKIGKGSAYNGVSKAEMAQTIHDQAAEISTIKANDAAKDKRIDALEKENQEMKKQIQEILARLNG